MTTRGIPEATAPVTPTCSNPARSNIPFVPTNAIVVHPPLRAGPADELRRGEGTHRGLPAAVAELVDVLRTQAVREAPAVRRAAVGVDDVREVVEPRRCQRMGLPAHVPSSRSSDSIAPVALSVVAHMFYPWRQRPTCEG